MNQEIADYLDVMGRQRAGLLAAVKDLPVEALDWRPLPEVTSSIAVLAHHAAGVIRLWFVEGLTGRDIGRVRDDEFAVQGRDAAALAAVINGTYDEAEAALKGCDPAMLDRAAPLTVNHNTRGQVHTPRFGIAYALNHAGEHIGHMGLTRQLWEARAQ
ncbi:MAG: DinB family protein [Dehalococcoidia bacterium]